MLIPIGDAQAFIKSGKVEIDPKAHTLILGKSGVGKSVLLGNIAANLARAGWGFLLADPHGDLYDFALEHIPSNRIRDVVCIDPMDDSPVPLNPFYGKNPRRALDNFASAVWNVWPSGRGPRSEWVFENACRSIMEAVQSPTVLHLNRFLVRADYRAKIRKRVKEPDLVDFFHTLEDEWDKRQREEAMAPLVNKMGRFVSDARLRNILGQPGSLEFAELMDRRSIILCRLAKGSLGADVSSIIGSIIVSKVASALLERESQAPAERVPFALLLDEAQSYSRGVSLDVLLPEARKYGAGVWPATQSLALFPEEVEEAIFAGCSNFVSFRVSGKNAKKMAEEFGDDFPATAIQKLSNAEAYAKVVRAGIAIEPAKIRCYPPIPPGRAAKPASIRSWSRTKYGTPRPKVERAIRQMLGG